MELSKLATGLPTVSEWRCVWARGTDRTVRPRHWLPTVTRVVWMDGTGSVKRTVRANALRHPASSVGAAESKGHSEEQIQLSGGGGTFYCMSSLLDQYKELRAMVIFSLPHFLKWAVINGYWHCHFGEGAEGLTGTVAKFHRDTQSAKRFLLTAVV